jgi:alcohol dehydrogenase (NADP+)
MSILKHIQAVLYLSRFKGIKGGRAVEVLRRTLGNGTRIPVVGMGTFGSDKYNAAQVAEAVIAAGRLGYRHFDCASVYGNEPQVGESLHQVMAGGVPREELWVTSKVWNDKHKPADLVASCKQSLHDLKLDYLDLYLVHWPFPNFHPEGCDVSYHDPDAKPYIHAAFMETWQAMEALVKAGLVKSIGTSNMTVPKMKLLLRDCVIRPVVNEMELHPHFQQAGFYSYLISNGIQPVGFCPIGSPSRPARDRTAADTCEFEDPDIGAIAKRLGVHPAYVCLAWAVQRGEVVIPFSVKQEQLAANLRAAVPFQLTLDEMNRMEKIDKNCRLIKGQVFVWRRDADWRILWDEDGIIKA